MAVQEYRIRIPTTPIIRLSDLLVSLGYEELLLSGSFYTNYTKNLEELGQKNMTFILRSDSDMIPDDLSNWVLYVNPPLSSDDVEKIKEAIYYVYKKL
ncbi:MAG: hypothetical protein HZB67_00885 [Candidatus Aenigmarchaeota archaeon]|nr:hypothetical protein [Candidatus Aenigmarchaeota archaeon]